MGAVLSIGRGDRGAAVVRPETTAMFATAIPPLCPSVLPCEFPGFVFPIATSARHRGVGHALMPCPISGKRVCQGRRVVHGV